MPLDSAIGSILAGLPSSAGMPRTAPAAPGTPGAGPPGAPPPGAGGPPTGAVPDEIFASIANKRMSQSQGVDVQAISNQLRQIMTTVAAMIPKVALKVNTVDKHLTRAYAALQMALKEAEQASQNNVAAGPINFSGALAAPGAGMPAGTTV